jgi:Xylose isomerase-like TIM barrel
VEAFGWAADAFAGTGTTVAIEPQNYQEANIIRLVPEAVAFVKEVGRDEVRTMVDFYHVYEEQEPLDDVSRNGEWIVHVQTADTGRRHRRLRLLRLSCDRRAARPRRLRRDHHRRSDDRADGRTDDGQPQVPQINLAGVTDQSSEQSALYLRTVASRPSGSTPNLLRQTAQAVGLYI